MRCNSSKPDIPVILSGTLKFLAGCIGVTFFLIFHFFAFLFCGLLDESFCWKATLIRSMASSVGTNLNIKARVQFTFTAITDRTRPPEQKFLDKKLIFNGCQSSPPPVCVWSQNYKLISKSCVWKLLFIRQIISLSFAPSLPEIKWASK